MDRKVIVYMAASLDGYIATEDDSLEWLFKTEGEGDNGYSEFIETIDTIILGRRTYDWIMEKELGGFPYRNQKCYVFSNRITGSNKNVEFIREDIISFLNRIKKTSGKNIWIVGGGVLLQHFIKAQLIDEYIITIAPILIGRGIPLFKEIDAEVELELKNIRRFNQFVELHYLAKRRIPYGNQICKDYGHRSDQ